MRKLHHAGHKSVSIQDEFWNLQMEKIHKKTVWDILDKFEHDHEECIMKNYEWVAQNNPGRHIGPPWYDGLICEVIRGVSDIIAVTYDEALVQKIDYYTSMIEKAQNSSPDGYINTYTTLICPDQKWGQNGGSLIWQHETYNIGCLVEAGVHYYRATNKDNLLKCAVKAANCMCTVMGDTPRKNIVPAHSLAEEAMVKLYLLFSEQPDLISSLKEKYGIDVNSQDYLGLAKFWMDNRGVHENRASLPRYMGEYSQDHCKITDQSEAVGHAVRAALMYTGLAAVGMETGEKKYLDAAKRIWDNVEQTKLHISGGIGAVHNEERFGFQYDLPNNAYLETCAGVAMAFWAGEMHNAFAESHYIDVLEFALYNNVLPALSLDGTHYFYENPLISDGTVERWDWHGCPCCPPMFLKLMGSMQDYIYSLGQSSVYVNLHIGSSLNAEIGGKEVVIEQHNTGLPWRGENKISLHLKEDVSFTLAIRVPAWADKFTVEIDGELYTTIAENGYIMLDRLWKDGDNIEIKMELPAVKVVAHPYVDADTGRIALVRGAMLYCLEEIDNPLGTDIILAQDEITIEEIDLFGNVIAINGVTSNGKQFRAIPYYLWNNRGKGKMDVWICQLDKNEDTQASVINAEQAAFAAHSTKANIKKLDLTGWDGKLYRRW